MFEVSSYSADHYREQLLGDSRKELTKHKRRHETQAERRNGYGATRNPILDAFLVKAREWIKKAPIASGESSSDTRTRNFGAHGSHDGFSRRKSYVWVIQT